MAKTHHYFTLSLFTFLLIACSTQIPPTITPPTTSTITTQITEPAAIEIAKRVVFTPRLYQSGEPPRVVFAQYMPLHAAHTIVHQRPTGPTTTALETQPVWLIYLKSDYSFQPPVPDATPTHVTQGCLYSILDATSGASLEAAAGIPCPQ